METVYFFVGVLLALWLCFAVIDEIAYWAFRRYLRRYYRR